MGKYRILGSLLDRVFRNNLNANFDDVDADIQAQKKRVDDLILSNPSPSEVQDARGGFTVLRDRLNKTDEQLADNATEIELALGTGLLGEKYPRLVGETDDGPRYQRALDALKAAGGGKLVLPNKTITISTNIKADPQNGSIVIEGSGSSKIIVATDSNTYGFTIGQTCYNQKNFNLNKNVTIKDVEFEASGMPKGGIFVEPGAFMPIIKNVKLKGFKGDGACIYVYNDGYNNATLSKYSWVDNATFEDVVCEHVKNGIWFVGNVQRAGEPGQTSNEDTFSQTKLKNCYISVSEVGGQAYHFEGSFARSVFEGPMSFLEGDALIDAQTNRELATSLHYFLKGNFRATTFNSLGAEGGGWVIRLDPSMLPDIYGDNANLDNLGTWINTQWLNIPDSTRKLLKIIDPCYKGRRVWIDVSGTKEVATLTITSVPTANGNITVSFDGVAVSITVATTDTVNAVGDKIRQAVFSNAVTSGTGGTVILTAKTAGNKQSATFDPGITGVGSTIVTSVEGVSSYRDYRRDTVEHKESGTYRLVCDTTKNSGFEMITIAFSEPFLEITDHSLMLSLEHLDDATKVLYASRVDGYGVHSFQKSNGKYTGVTFFCKVNTTVSQEVGFKFSISGRIQDYWDYYYN